MAEPLGRYENGRCEIRTMENELLSYGVLDAVLEEDDTPSVVIVPRGGDVMPSLRMNTMVKLAVMQRGLPSIFIVGRIYLSTDEFWRISQVRVLADGERRGYFRVGTGNTHVELEPILPAEDGSDQRHQVILSNISLSGVRIITERRYALGEQLRLNNVRLGDKLMGFPLYCTVRTDFGDCPAGRIYGCSFDDMASRETDTLCQAIFDLERQALRRRQGRR